MTICIVEPPGGFKIINAGPLSRLIKSEILGVEGALDQAKIHSKKTTESIVF